MASVETTPNPTNGAEVPVVNPNISEELSTYCLVESEVEKDGKIEKNITFMTEKAAQKAVEDKKGSIVATQTFKGYSAANDAGIAELVASEKERVKLFNRGADNKQYQIIRATMLETDKEGNYCFQPQEAVIDLRADLAEETASRATSVEAKVEKILDGLSGDAAAAMLAKLMARLNQSAQ